VTATPVAELRDVSFAYGSARGRDARRFGVHDVSFTVRAGEILGVIGPNSAGKTTLVRLLSGVLRPSGGDVLIDGEAAAQLSAAAIARRIAVVPQELPQAFPFTVEQLALMGRYPHAPDRFFETGDDLAIAREAMAAVGVLDIAAVPLDGLSGGERQRAVLARALAQHPRLLALDEPTAHLDLRYQASTAMLLRRLAVERGVAVLLVSHDLDLAAELCDRLLLLAEGRVVRAGAPDDVLDQATLETVFGAPVIVERSASTGRPLVRVAWEASTRIVRGGR
jgi:iron complex transport system ATP-binding protein